MTDHNTAIKKAADGDEPYCQTCAEGRLCPCTPATSSPVQMPAEQAWLGDRATRSVCSLSVHGPALKNCFRNLPTTLQSTKQNISNRRQRLADDTVLRNCQRCCILHLCDKLLCHVYFLSTVYRRDDVGKFKSGLLNRREKLVRFMVVRVEYDRSNRICIQGHVVGLPMQPPRGEFFCRGQAPRPSPRCRRRCV